MKSIRLRGKREKIFQQFLYAEKLRFSDLLKKTKISSNLLAYFLKKMCSDGLLESSSQGYKLTSAGEKLIPFFVHDQEKIGPLVVLLIACRRDNEVLLFQRHKRPYKNLWGFPAGRLLINESLGDAVKRIMREKAQVDVSLNSFHAVIYERLLEENNSKHGFLFLLADAIPLGEVKERSFLKWFSTKKFSSTKIIPSDAWLITEKLQEEIPVVEELLLAKKNKIEMKLIKK